LHPRALFAISGEKSIAMGFLPTEMAISGAQVGEIGKSLGQTRAANGSETPLVWILERAAADESFITKPPLPQRLRAVKHNQQDNREA